MWSFSVSTWYQKCMPRIKDVEPHLKNLFKEMFSMEQIKGMYVWGSYSKNIKNPNFRIKDIDVIARTKFNSGDLISIDEKITKESHSDNYLENQGYDPLSIKFSKNFTDIKKFNIDHWALSSDRKLLHWGPVLMNREESEEINEQGEKYASDITGINRKKINKSSEDKRKGWYQLYYNYITQQFQGMPSGWYKVEDMKIKDILEDAIKI
jgi:hypothetical protein